ncbi:uncharacterized protein LOC110768779 isoform X2 [Prunus avium]|uniref:Uncharacterized protein LOC110768779 isoform X2 n=1 Tax=Prunus avium TaxID=42229 RepID=A0A6P5TMM3_PRUAV|nr:uncharacterized protein LOC110768779 isoform X2 [Prunus avium]
MRKPPFVKISIWRTKTLPELKLVFPNAQQMNCGGQVISEIIETCCAHDFTDVVLVHEHRGVPDGLIISHLPFGPTAYFQLLNVVTRHDIKDKKTVGTMPQVYPHLILNNFTTKVLATRRILFWGKSENGLYPLKFSPNSSFHIFPNRVALLGLRVDSSVWHSHLGHPASPTLQFLISHNKLPLSGTKVLCNYVCHSCPLGKSVKLPFSSSMSVSTSPLELIHSDVWSSSNKSISGFSYYVLFVDDFSRYSWIFPMKLKYEVLSFCHI